MTKVDALGRGREAYARQAWGEAYARLSDADRNAPLEAADLDRLALAATLTGRDAASIDVGTRAHHEFLARDEPERAARCAYEMGMSLMSKGDVAQASGWFSRARRVLDDGGLDWGRDAEYVAKHIASSRLGSAGRREPVPA